ncbi:metallophosphoesterase [Actibacterium sp.]|uniref:metallophosphoesterase n=1 Tax=Actibacterium sp. TaxID=1872125 RepID=UPI00356374AF
MSTFDIIPDIHGQSAKLDAALAGLGWRPKGHGWTHPDPDRQIVFLGDFIDRGPDNRAVVRTVRRLIDSGRAQAIMGNHELNALHFHARHPDDGRPLRWHSEKNIRQHRTFLDQFPLGDPETHEVLDWMRGLPLFLETDGFRAVHASWSDDAIARLKDLTGDGVLSEDQLIRAAGRVTSDEIFELVEQITKGPESRLPEGVFFTDKDGTERHSVRLQWWNGSARTWREIAISVPHPQDLPDQPLPRAVVAQTYPADARPVFFGHYWLSGAPVLQAANALCLDYSAGRDGPLVSYQISDPATPLSMDNIRVHPAVG